MVWDEKEKMNFIETMFISASFGISVGIGVACARHYGTMGFFLGFIGTVVGIFFLLWIVLDVLPKSSRRKKPNGKNHPSK